MRVYLISRSPKCDLSLLIKCPAQLGEFHTPRYHLLRSTKFHQRPGIHECHLIIFRDVREPVRDSQDRAVAERRVNDILHRGFRVAVQTTSRQMRGSQRGTEDHDSPARRLIKNQDITASPPDYSPSKA